MMHTVDWILLVAVAVVCWPLVALGIELLASLLPRRRTPNYPDRPACVVLVPAHNEQDGISTTIQNLHGQICPGDRILVVADNCSDETAHAARAVGAEVLERQDETRRGKGFALDFGLAALNQAPPEIVVVVDADCELGPGSLDVLVRQAAGTQRPAQGIYLIGTGQESDPRRRLSAFAVQLKNQIRPLGLHRLGLPCLLTGTGMAFPWRTLESASLGNGNIVEDMRLGVDLALAGYPPGLCPEAVLSGAAAPSRTPTIKQRTRWEHGHVQTIMYGTPRLLRAGIVRMRPSLIGLGLELGIPPLSLVCAAWLVVTTMCIICWQILSIHWASAALALSCFAFSASAVLLSWMKHSRRILPPGSLLSAPFYVAWKVPIYAKLLIGRQKSWERTDRVAAQK